MISPNNVTWQHFAVSRSQRADSKHQNPCVIWLTGLSGSGKSTIANSLDYSLHKLGYHTFLLDGDNIRHGLCQDLGFSSADRVENIRRVGQVSKLLTDAGLIVLTAFISPFSSDRQMVRSLFQPGEFLEIHLNTPLEICEQRDPKGLYDKARKGLIQDFTGIDSPYEPPTEAELTLDTSDASIGESVESVIKLLQREKIVR